MRGLLPEMDYSLQAELPKSIGGRGAIRKGRSTGRTGAPPACGTGAMSAPDTAGGLAGCFQLGGDATYILVGQVVTSWWGLALRSGGENGLLANEG